ncbi:MAG: helix-turn-helix domain-containing protein [Myxococcota bacterium]|jgi:AcrR family transcriptional regulator|nr:helix-turn-helix domain-containing protein [Myxococcota bacterium]
MPQVQKAEIRHSLLHAARYCFAERGVAASTMAEIASRAGLSTGNTYRYFRSKEELLAEAIGPDFEPRLKALLRERVLALRGVDHLSKLSADAPFHKAAAALNDFCITHRVEVLIVLDGAEGTVYQGLRAELESNLVELAQAHFKHQYPDRKLTDIERFQLQLIYRNHLSTLIAILRRFEDAASIREALSVFSRYHLSGLRALFVADSPHPQTPLS